MKLFWKTTILLTLITCATTVIPLARAQHATNFLNALEREVTNRLANPPTNSTAAQRRALVTANKTLSRTSTTLAADLNLFASTATTLSRPFAGDDRFAAIESQVIELYSAEGRARMNWLVTHVGTNAIARSTSNQLAQARRALDRASNVSNSVPVRARVLATAFTKLGLADTQIRRTITAPAAFTAKGVLLSEDAIINERTNFYLAHAGDRFTYNVDHPEELGLWSYRRVSPAMGIVTLAPNCCPLGVFPPRVMTLVFTNLISGTFTGQNIAGENLRGMFLVSE